MHNYFSLFYRNAQQNATAVAEGSIKMIPPTQTTSSQGSEEDQHSKIPETRQVLKQETSQSELQTS